MDGADDVMTKEDSGRGDSRPYTDIERVEMTPPLAVTVTPSGCSKGSSMMVALSQSSNVSTPASCAVTVEEHLQRHLKPRKLALVIIALACANAADAVEVMAAGLFITKYRHPNGSPLAPHQREMVTSSIFAGMLVGGVVGGWISDHLGRKPTLVLFLFLNAIGAILSAFAPTLYWLIAFRAMAGIGVGGSIPPIFALGGELFVATSRGTYMSYIASFWCLGALYEASIAWLVLGNDLYGNRIIPGATWRAFVLATALPVVVTLVFCIRFLPRSPRWLISQARYAEACLALYRLTGVSVSTTSLRRAYPYKSNKHSFCRRTAEDLTQVFRAEQLRTTCCLIVVWFAICYGSYGISSWIIVIFEDIQITNEFASRFLFAAASVPGNLASVVLIEYLGRKRLLCSSLLLAAVFGFAFTATATPRLKGLAVIAACCFNTCLASAWNALDALTTESFPTHIRTTGFGFLSAIGRLASIAAQAVNGQLEHESVGLMLAITAVAMVLGSLSAMHILHEPAGISMEGLEHRPEPLLSEQARWKHLDTE